MIKKNNLKEGCSRGMSPIPGVDYCPEGDVSHPDPYVPAVPVYINGEGRRSGEAYNQVIDQFEVETSQRYQPRGEETYCNFYAQDVMTAMGTGLPRMTAQDYEVWLPGPEGQDAGWAEVSGEEARYRANCGYPTVVVGDVHIAVVCPGEEGDTGTVVSQAGLKCYRCVSIAWAYTAEAIKKRISYFTHE